MASKGLFQYSYVRSQRSARRVAGEDVQERADGRFTRRAPPPRRAARRPPGGRGAPGPTCAERASVASTAYVSLESDPPHAIDAYWLSSTRRPTSRARSRAGSITALSRTSGPRASTSARSTKRRSRRGGARPTSTWGRSSAARRRRSASVRTTTAADRRPRSPRRRTHKSSLFCARPTKIYRHRSRRTTTMSST